MDEILRKYQYQADVGKIDISFIVKHGFVVVSARLTSSFFLVIG